MANDTIGSLVAVTTVTAGQFTAGMKEIESSLDSTHAHAVSLDWGEAFQLDAAFEAIHEGIELAREGIDQFFESIERVGQLKNFSEQVGATTQEIQGLRYAAEQFHVSSEDLDGALTKMEKAIGELNAGGKASVDMFGRLGLSAKDFAGLSAEESFEKIGDKIKELKNHADETYSTMEIFGRGAAGLVNIFNAGSEAINRFKDEAKDAGLILSSEYVAAAEEAELAMKKLHAQWESFTDHLLAAASPVLIAIADKLREVGKYLTQHAADITTTVLEWTKLAAEITAALLIFPKVVSGVKAIVVALQEMAEAESIAEAFSGPEGIAALAAGIAAAAGAVLVIDNQFSKLADNAKRAAAAIHEVATETKDLHEAASQAAGEGSIGDGILPGMSLDKIMDETAKAVAKNDDAMAKMGEAITKSLRTPMEKYRDAVMEANTALQAHAITHETYGRAVAKATEQLEKQWAAQNKPPEFHETPGTAAALVGTMAGFSAVAAGERKAADEEAYRSATLEWQQKMLQAIDGMTGGFGGAAEGIVDTTPTADF